MHIPSYAHTIAHRSEQEEHRQSVEAISSELFIRTESEAESALNTSTASLSGLLDAKATLAIEVVGRIKEEVDYAHTLWLAQLCFHALKGPLRWRLALG